MGSVKKVMKEAFESGRYMVAITFVDPKTGILQHRFESYSFPVDDITGAFAEMEKLALKSAQTASVSKSVPGDR